MRKMITVLTSVLMIFTLAACGKNESKQSMPDNQSDTVANATADPHSQQTLYLWEDGNVPDTTEYTQNNGNYADNPDFRPYVVNYHLRPYT